MANGETIMIFIVEQYTPWVSYSQWKAISAYITRDEALTEIRSYEEGSHRIVQVQARGVLAAERF